MMITVTDKEVTLSGFVIICHYMNPTYIRADYFCRTKESFI